MFKDIGTLRAEWRPGWRAELRADHDLHQDLESAIGRSYIGIAPPYPPFTEARSPSGRSSLNLGHLVFDEVVFFLAKTQQAECVALIRRQWPTVVPSLSWPGRS